MIRRHARTNPIEQDESLNFTRFVLDQLTAKHDPEASRETLKGLHMRLPDLQQLAFPDSPETKIRASRALLVGGLVLLVILLVLSIPPLREYLCGHMLNGGIVGYIKVHKLPLSSWLECITLWLDVFIAVCIGGEILTGSIKKGIQEYFKQAEDVANNMLKYRGVLEIVIPDTHKFFLTLSLAVNFPGGFFGLTAYAAFLLTVAARVLKFYLDSPVFGG